MEIPERADLTAALLRIAQAAYQAHNAALMPVNQDKMPDWYALPLSVQRCWLHAAVAVLVEAKFSEPVLRWLKDMHQEPQRPSDPRPN